MTTQIFNEQGFLTVDGKSFLNDGFTKEVKKIMATAGDASDALTISCILKAIIGETMTNHIRNITPTPPTKPKSIQSELPKASLKLIKSDVKNNVIAFPGNKAVGEIGSLLTALTDYPLMEHE